MAQSKLLKAFNIRISKELWTFIKREAMDREISMNALVVKCLQKHMEKKLKKKLKVSDTMVSCSDV